MGGLIEVLIVVDAEDLAAAHGSTESPDLRREVASPNMRENRKRR